MIVADYSRPFWPLFLHILGAMTTFGAVITAVILLVVAWMRPDLEFLRRATFRTLLAAIPFYVLLRVFSVDIPFGNPTLVIIISFFTAKRRWGIAVPLCGWALLIADVGLMALSVSS